MNAREIFATALQKNSPADRSAFLATACGEDRALRQQIEALLQEHDTLGSFLETPPTELREVIRDQPTHDSFATEGGGSDKEVLHELLAPSDTPGHLGRFGPYEVTEVVGQGGMGIVLKAMDSALHRFVAVKILAPQLAANAGARKRFLREAQAAAAVSHDHVVTIHAVDEWLPPHATSAALPYLVMQLVSGESLQERLDRTGPLELKEILRIGMQTAAGLAAAHAQGLIHRDVKPANILLENGVERVKITDFGLARAVDDASLTQEGMVAGTPQYMSPEQARGEAVDHRTDLFSLGSVLYAMCTGHPPFRATSTMATLRCVSDDTPRPIKQLNADIPDWLVAIVDKLLAKNPDERFQSAGEVAQLLSECLAHVQQPSAAPLPEIPGLAASGTIKRPRLRRYLAAAAVVCLIVAGLGFSEATGVTHFVPMMIRVVTGEGTLIVQVDDPDISVTIDGSDLVITGPGLRELRLRPGDYKLRAMRDGQPIRETLVTIVRGGKEVLNVGREPSAEIRTAKPLAPRSVLEMHTSWVEGLAFSPNGKTLATGSNDQYVGLWDTATGDLRGQFHAADGLIASLAYSPDGAVLVSGSGHMGKLRVWDAATFKLLGEAKQDEFVSAVAFGGRDDPVLAEASDDKTVKLWKWDGATLVHMRTLGEHSSGVTAMSFNPQGSRIASTTWDGMLYLWDVKAGEQLKSVRLGPEPRWCVAFSPDGKTIAAGGYRKTVELRNADTLESLGTLLGHKEWVWSLVFLPDGETLISAGGHYDEETQQSNRPGELKFWDIAALKECLSVDGYESGIRSVALSPDGKTLATGDFANLVRLWDVAELLAAAEREAAKSEPEAFVVLGGKDIPERKFDTLADAVVRASDGDTIEIRGNGPFHVEPIEIGNQALTLRAGSGFRPSLQLDSPKAEPLLTTAGPLVLEGIELVRRSQGAAKRDEPCAYIVETRGSELNVANCRLVRNVVFRGSCVVSHGSTRLAFRNAEFLNLNPDGDASILYTCPSSGTLLVENIVSVGAGWCAGLNLALNHVPVQQASVRLRNNTWAMGTAVYVRPSSDVPEKPRLSIEADQNVFASGTLFLNYNPLKGPATQPWADIIPKVMAWRDEGSLYPAKLSVWAASVEAQAERPFLEDIAGWDRLWNREPPGSLTGRPKFQGGDIYAIAKSGSERLKPEDFRLRPDSPGYRAGPDGKDLGADTDLVGPGDAYERWKKTPEYQQWLKDTGQEK